MRKLLTLILLSLILISGCTTVVQDKVAPSHYIVEYIGSTNNYYVNTLIRNEVQDGKIVFGNVSVSATIGVQIPTNFTNLDYRLSWSSCDGVYQLDEDPTVCWKANCKNVFVPHTGVERVENDKVIEEKEIFASCDRWPPRLYEDVTKIVDNILQDVMEKIENGEEPFQPGNFAGYYFPDADTDEVIQIFKNKVGCNPGLCYQEGYLRWFNYRERRAKYSYNVTVLAD